jgi:hypothetical protein
MNEDKKMTDKKWSDQKIFLSVIFCLSKPNHENPPPLSISRSCNALCPNVREDRAGVS